MGETRAERPRRVSDTACGTTPATLHRRHYVTLVRTAALMVDDADLAEEIVQDAFAGLVEKWHTLDPVKAVGYLYRAVANGAKSALRRRRTTRAHRPDPVGHAPAAEASVLAAAGYDRLLHAVAELPLRQRQVLVLRYFNELSVDETAQVLGLRGTAVRAACHRALGSLARHEDLR